MRKALLVTSLAVIWVSISVSSILVLLSGESAWVCAFWRLTLSLPLLALSALITRTPLNARLSPRNTVASVTAGALLALHFVTWMESLHLISVALSTTLVVTYPAISALIGHAIMHVKVRREEVIGLLIALGGVIAALYNGLIGSNVGPSWPLGSALAIIGAFAAAGYFSLGGHLRSSGMNLAQYTLLAYGSAAAWLLLASTLAGVHLIPTRPEAWPYLLALAAIPMMGGHTLMNYLLKRMPAHVVTSIALGEPAGASILAAAILGQVPSANVVVGMTLTMFGVWLVIRSSSYASNV